MCWLHNFVLKENFFKQNAFFLGLKNKPKLAILVRLNNDMSMP